MPVTDTSPSLDCLNPDTNNGSCSVVSMAPGFDFVFVRNADANRTVPNIRLFGDADLTEFDIAEVSDSGSVPTLRAHNKSPFDVLLIAGQLVKGGKQNRGINADMLVYAGMTAQIPVTCVEQGRWSGQPGARFRHGGFEPTYLRHGKMRDVHACRMRGEQAAANQGEVWSKIACMSQALGTSSASSDLISSSETVAARRLDARLVRPVVRGNSDEQYEFLQRRMHRLRQETQDLMQVIQRLVSDDGIAQLPEYRRALDHALRELSLVESQMQRLREERERGDEPTPETVTPERIGMADNAAQGSSGLLVFFDGEFLAGDIFADANWFAKVYGDLRNSALMSWDFASHNAARRRQRLQAQPQDRIELAARGIIRDTVRGQWIERPAIAHGRSQLLEHSAYEGSVLLDRDSAPLHLLIGSRSSPSIFATTR